MGSKPHLLLLFLLFTLTSAANDDQAVMDSFTTSLTPPPTGWTTGTPYCKWSGVTCDPSNRVTSINLPSKSLSGSLPQNLNSLSQLSTLFLQNNRLTGPLPSLSNLSYLQSLYLDSNNFSSIGVNSFSGLTSLQEFSLSDNVNLAPWVFPTELSDSTNLVKIYVSNTNLFGELPEIFDSFSGLQQLRMSYNNITGPLPRSLNSSGVQILWLNNQAEGISGDLSVVSEMNQLAQVWLHQNRFSGGIPEKWVSQEIFDLQLRGNLLTGIVPAAVVNLPKLVNVTLQNNKLQGPVPQFPPSVEKAEVGSAPATNSYCRNDTGECDVTVNVLIEVAKDFGYPIKLAEAWVGNDACGGWAFVTCDANKNVITVNLAKLGFNGTISPALGNLTSLKEVYLNDNNLTGSIPDSLASLAQLRKIDVSNNNLSGKLPAFRSGVSVVTDGNKNIGKDVPASGGGSGGGSASGKDGSGGGSKRSSNSSGRIAGLVIAGLVLLGLLGFAMFMCYRRKRRVGSFGKVQNPEAGIGNEMVKTSVMPAVNGYAGVPPSDLQSQSSGDPSEFPVFEGGNVAISIQVLRQVTNNFSEHNILGRGGFGVVYSGELHDGTKIAVKRMESGAMGTKGMSEFQAEIAVLTKVRHRHLVALLGFCVNGNERLLVYEYMPQGTLGQHLFDWQEFGYPPLTWKQRVTIALDVARGVEYLHSLAQTSFIHRDLKPSNILLSDDMRAKVADFGLVKNAPDGKYSVETRLAGTFGYLAPEYAVTGRVTTKIDVYAFGVILMELLTGRKALDETQPDERSHLVTWFRRVLINKDNLFKSIDGILDPDDETYESICRVAELAGHCTAREPHQRPDMGHAVNVLGPLVEQWKPSCQEDEDSYGIDLHMSLPQALQRWQADEGTSTMISDYSRTQASIPAKPSGFADSFDSMDCR